MAADNKNSKTIKINIFSRMAWYIWLKWKISGAFMLNDIKMKKNVARQWQLERFRLLYQNLGRPF